jgi:ankyrin repeat protein
VCGLTLREGARRADSSMVCAGFAGGPADLIRLALETQAPWLRAARLAPRENVVARDKSEYMEGTTSLMRAADAGDERRVRELLAAGAPLRCVDHPERRTALHLAILRGNARVVTALLEADAAGETVVAHDRWKRTPLMYASSLRGREDIVSALLACGARQELTNDFDDTALHAAASNGHASVIDLLCAAPGAAAVLALGDRWGRTPLIRASEKGHEGAARALLAHGARQEQRDGNGKTALHFAATKGHTGVVELLCTAPGAATALALRDHDGNSPLMIARSTGDAGAVRAMLAIGARQEGGKSNAALKPQVGCESRC